MSETTTRPAAAPPALEAFLREGPPELPRVMATLGAAHWLTEQVAVRLLARCSGVSSLRPEVVVPGLRACDFVVEGNDDEFYFREDVRAEMRRMLGEDRALFECAHRTLLDLAAAEGVNLPSYLSWRVGLAYHTTPLDPEAGLRLYRDCYTGKPTGKQWVLGVLAEQQQREGLIPADDPLPSFLRGVTCYHDGELGRAARYFDSFLGSRHPKMEADYANLRDVARRVRPGLGSAAGADGGE